MRALVKTNEGYRYRGGSLGDDHVFTTKTDFTVASSVDAVVDAELVEATDDASAVAIALGVHPRNGDDEPDTDLDLGDAASVADIDGTHQPYRCVSIKTQESALGVVQFGLEVNSQIESKAAVTQRWLDQVTPGSLSGRSDQISGANLGVGVPFGQLRKGEAGLFQQSGPVFAELNPADPDDTGHSDDWPVDDPILFYRVRWALQQAGDTDTIVHLRINGGGPFSRSDGSYTSNFFHEIVIPAFSVQNDDDTNDGAYTNYPAFKGDKVRAAVYQAGDFARGLVVRLKWTTQT